MLENGRFLTGSSRRAASRCSHLFNRPVFGCSLRPVFAGRWRRCRGRGHSRPSLAARAAPAGVSVRPPRGHPARSSPKSPIRANRAKPGQTGHACPSCTRSAGRAGLSLDPGRPGGSRRVPGILGKRCRRGCYKNPTPRHTRFSSGLGSPFFASSRTGTENFEPKNIFLPCIRVSPVTRSHPLSSKGSSVSGGFFAGGPKSASITLKPAPVLGCDRVTGEKRGNWRRRQITGERDADEIAIQGRAWGPVSRVRASFSPVQVSSSALSGSGAGFRYTPTSLKPSAISGAASSVSAAIAFVLPCAFW